MHSVKLSSEVQKEFKNWVISQKILDKVSSYLSEKGHRARVKAGLENALMNLQPSENCNGLNLFMKVDNQAVKNGFTYASIQLEEFEAQDIVKVIKETSTFYNDNVEIPADAQMTSDAFHLDPFELKRNQYIDKAFEFVSTKTTESDAANAILRSALRYSSIYAETRHIGPPQRVYDKFYEWGIRNEGFASPFNARLLGKTSAQFYSLFKDTDAIFGSAGSFFNLNQPENPGHWCLDPPFTTEIMSRVDEILKEWLSKYQSLSFLLIIPESHTPANKPDETVTLKKDAHYYEGLEGVLKPLPVNVCIHRYGNLKGFSADAILEGYSK